MTATSQVSLTTARISAKAAWGCWLVKALVMLTALAPLSITTGAASAAESAPARWSVAIDRGDLSDALAQLAQQVGVDLARFSDVDSGRIVVGPVRGELTREEALEQLLRDTGLAYRFVNAHTVAIVHGVCVPDSTTGTPTAEQPGGDVMNTNITSTVGAVPGPSRLWTWVVGVLGGDRSRTARRSARARAAAVAVLCGSMGLAAGPRVQAAEPPSSDGLVSLEEVTVTAQRREENAQKVPISIDIVSGDDAELRGATNIQTLSATIPNLTNTGSFYSHTYIRGVGATNGSPNNEPSAATYIDGVYMPSSFALFGSFNNIERVEVLKGPQGTLFGRNTTGGVVQIITADPKHEFGGQFEVGLANYDTINSQAYVTGGVTDKLAADVSVMYENQGSGWGRNLTRNIEIYKHRNVAARSKWLYTPSEATRINVALDYVTFDFSSGLAMLPGSINPADATITYAGRFNAYGDPTVHHAEQRGVSARVDHDFSAVHGASITAYRHVEGYEFHDNDRVPARRSYVQAYNFADYVMQEFQLSNLNPGKVTWLVGAFLYGNLVDANNPRIETGTTVTPGQYREVYGRQKTRSYSGYGQATADVFTDTKLTLGLRYTKEDLTEDGKYLNAAKQLINGSPFNSTTSYNPWTWRVALDRQFRPDVLGYVSYNHGFKSGGYNLPTPERAQFLPETLDAYEMGGGGGGGGGLKSEVMDHRLRLNAALFYYDYKNIQVTIVPGGSGQIFTNAAAARNYGLDANLEFAATDHVTLSAGLGLLDAKYKDYPSAQGFTASGAAINLANASGKSLPFAPPVSGFVGASYRVPISTGEIRASANVAYSGRYFISPVEVPVMAGYYNIGAAVEWRSQADKPLGVRLWGRNLSDSYIASGTTSSSGGWYSSYSAPRTFGVTLLKDF